MKIAALESDCTMTPDTKSEPSETKAVLEAKGLSKCFFTPQGAVHAVRLASFRLKRGFSLGIMGESGSGKTTLAMMLMRLVKPDSGDVLLDGESFLKLKGKRLKLARKRIQMVFQDTYQSLDPRMDALAQVREPILVHHMFSGRSEADKRAFELLDMVGVSKRQARLLPHELNGGARQRICIARALAPSPDILICDESVSSLDFALRDRILTLLAELRISLRLSMVFISHNADAVRRVCQGIAIMRDGTLSA